MSELLNEFGQPLGRSVEGWAGASEPNRESIEGRRCRLETLNADKHAAGLHAAYSESPDGRSWTYLPYGPFDSEEAYTEFVRGILTLTDTYFFTIIDSTSGAPMGVASYLRVTASMGTIEVGHLSYAPVLQQTPTSTEAMYLMMKRVFDEWGYRRYEWKCHSLNAPSCAAAKRLGFRFDGLFRNHVVAKGRNRDTAWYSITIEEWPAIREAMESWLEPANFDESGRQKTRLTDLMPDSAGKAHLAEIDSA